MLTTLEKIKTHLLVYGITESLEIEEEAEEMILTTLESDGIESVVIEDGALVIEFKE
jgi:hypothetical protein